MKQATLVRSFVLTVAGGLVAAGCGSYEVDPTVEAMPAALSGPERFIVQFHDGARGHAALSAAGANIVLELGPQNAAAATIPAGALEGLRRNPAIALIEPDPIREALPFDTTTPQVTPYGISLVGADAVAYGSAKRTVCIIDSGYDLTHPDLPHGTGGSVGGEGDSRTGRWNIDRCGHGTHVAGTIAALGNAYGVVGVAPGDDLDLYAVKVFGTERNKSCNWAYASSLVDATNKCKANGANVISMSLGGGGSSTVEANAFASLLADGILSVAAAGNSGTSSYSYPASYDAVVSVAAVDSSLTKASFSQYNAQVELAAPGVGVESTIPLDCGYCPKGGDGYDSWNGTSMATPHVSGVAALIWSHDPTKTAADVRTALQRGAQDLGAAGRDVETGFGLVDAVKSLFCLANPTDASCAAPAEPVCGDSVCNGSETGCDCAADCGAAPSSEAACDDGADDDCDGAVDCADGDCAAAAACAPGTAGQCEACVTDADCTSGARCFQLSGESGRTCHLACGAGLPACPSPYSCGRVTHGYGSRCLPCQ